MICNGGGLSSAEKGLLLFNIIIYSIDSISMVKTFRCVQFEAETINLEFWILYCLFRQVNYYAKKLYHPYRHPSLANLLIHESIPSQIWKFMTVLSVVFWNSTRNMGLGISRKFELPFIIRLSFAKIFMEMICLCDSRSQHMPVVLWFTL